MLFEPSRLLYPISNKNYEQDAAISSTWEDFRRTLKVAFMVTVFGYGAPKSDAAALEIMKNGWGNPIERFFEQIEIIDIRHKATLFSNWKQFIHSHHYEIHKKFYKSWLFNHPRRTGEAYINETLAANFIEPNPIPRTASLEKLWRWFEPLVEVENRHDDSQL